MPDQLRPLPHLSAAHEVTHLAPVALAGFDRDLTCAWANPRFGDLVGRTGGCVVGVGWDELVRCLAPDERAGLDRVVAGTSPGLEVLAIPGGRGAHPSVRETWRLQLYPLTTGDRVEGVGLVGVDVTDDLVRLEGLRRRADVDGLTGLLNRTAFHERLHERARDRAGSGRTRLLVVDLDGFKQVNDTFGHAAGDAVLAAVGRRLLGRLREGDVAGRIGGDEFAVLTHDGVGREDQLSARTLRQALCRPVELGPGCAIPVSVAIGHAAVTSGSTPEQVFAAADAAMYAAKRRAHARRGQAAPAAGGGWPLRGADPVLDRACALVRNRSAGTEREALESLALIARATHRTLLEVAADIDQQDRHAAARRRPGAPPRTADVVPLRSLPADDAATGPR